MNFEFYNELEMKRTVNLNGWPSKHVSIKHHIIQIIGNNCWLCILRINFFLYIITYQKPKNKIQYSTFKTKQIDRNHRSNEFFPKSINTKPKNDQGKSYSDRTDRKTERH